MSVGSGGSFGSHLGGLSEGGFHNAPLAINTGRFTSPSALAVEPQEVVLG
jgi:hypothetical protein